MSIVQAAAVINIFDGIVAILPLSFKIILDSLPNPIIADYWMLLWCGISSTIVSLFSIRRLIFLVSGLIYSLRPCLFFTFGIM